MCTYILYYNSIYRRGRACIFMIDAVYIGMMIRSIDRSMVRHTADNAVHFFGVFERDPVPLWTGAHWKIYFGCMRPTPRSEFDVNCTSKIHFQTEVQRTLWMVSQKFAEQNVGFIKYIFIGSLDTEYLDTFVGYIKLILRVPL